MKLRTLTVLGTLAVSGIIMGAAALLITNAFLIQRSDARHDLRQAGYRLEDVRTLAERYRLLVVDEWQPIETAPDNQRVLVFAIQTKRWVHDPRKQDNVFETKIVLWKGVATAYHYGKNWATFFPNGSGWLIEGAYLAEPTHWKPLPLPPVVRAGITIGTTPGTIHNIIRGNIITYGDDDGINLRLFR